MGNKFLKIRNFVLLIFLLPKLGIISTFKVLIYRFGIKSGFLKFISPSYLCDTPELNIYDKEKIPKASFFNKKIIYKCKKTADLYLSGKAKYFFKKKYNISSPPNWFFDPKEKIFFLGGESHWTKCKTFRSSDIKFGWELSRWEWSTTFARAWRFSKNKKYLEILELWTKDWCKKNPVNMGINWLCGQEVSIRLINAIQTWYVLDYPKKKPKILPGRHSFALSHIRRIYKTTLYAEGQKNNHWISEAAAMFIASNWLLSYKSNDKKEIIKYSVFARKSLERALRQLFLSDGTFSQQSCNYHRFVIDTLIQVEFWRERLEVTPFTKEFYNIIFLAINWLCYFVDPISGEVPNLGSNDGTYCYALHDEGYNDFRPTISLAYLIFKKVKIFNRNKIEESIFWMDLKEGKKKEIPNLSRLKVFNNGGYAFIKPNFISWALLRIPKYEFRPAQCDPLHVDLWHKGKNILRDAGTFSYNSGEIDSDYFSGIKGHNSIEFDGKNPMPKLSRFIWGNWFKSSISSLTEEDQKLSVSSEYKFFNGFHKRTLLFDSYLNEWRIIDQFSNFKQVAKVSWRLYPIDWYLEGNNLKSEIGFINFNSNNQEISISLKRGWESKYYGSKSSIPLVEIIFSEWPSKLITTINLY